MKRFAQVCVLATDVRAPNGKLGPNESSNEGQQTSKSPGAQNQKRCVYLLGNNIRVDENTGADDAAHYDHGGVEESESTS
jgi:hypothetical protein